MDRLFGNEDTLRGKPIEALMVAVRDRLVSSVPERLTEELSIAKIVLVALIAQREYAALIAAWR